MYESLSGGVRACLECVFFYKCVCVREDMRMTSHQGRKELLSVSIDIAALADRTAAPQFVASIKL